MRVIFFSGAGLVAGKERQLLNVMAQFSEVGHDVFCVMSSWGAAEYAALLKDHGIPYKRMRIGFISKTLTFDAIRMTLHQLIYVPALWINYRRLLREFKPDAVVHTNFH